MNKTNNKKKNIDFSWQDGALCKGIPVSEFFVGAGNHVKPSIVRLCNECPVKDECLNHALKHEDYGFWAGTTEKERDRLRKKLKIKLVSPQIGIYVEAPKTPKWSTVKTKEPA